MEYRPKSITFFFPYPYISGVPVLFSNLANYLVQNTSFKINIVDYKDGATIRNCIPHPNLHLIEFRDFEECHIDFETCLIFQAGIPCKLRSELKIGNQVKMFQWAAHEFNLVPYMCRLSYIRKLQERHFFIYRIFRFFNSKKSKVLSRWAETMINQGNIFFMTEIIFKITQKYLNLCDSTHACYLPNFGGGRTSYSSRAIEIKAKEIGENLDLAWVGRMGDFKIEILNYSIKKLSEVAVKKKISIRIHIIGGGEYEDSLKLNNKNNYLEVLRVGQLEKREVDIYLRDKVHALFAMGTSALDGARIGLPVVLLDQSYQEIKKDYKFKYLHDSSGFDLGHPITNDDYEEGNTTLENIIIGLKKNYINLSKECYCYYKDNHEIESVSSKFLDFIENKGYHINEVPQELKRLGLMRRIYLLYMQKIKKTYYPPAG